MIDDSDRLQFNEKILQPGRTPEEHRRFIADTKGWQIKPFPKSEEDLPFFNSFSGTDLFAGSAKPRNFAVEHLLPSPGSMLICGPTGCGKSKLVMYLAWCLATKSPFLEKFRVTKQHQILIFDGEMTWDDNSENLRKTALGLGLIEERGKEESGRFQIIDSTSKGDDIDISNTDHQKEIMVSSRDFDVIIFDNLCSLDQSGSHNFQKSWPLIASLFRKLVMAGKSIILLHHTNKAGKELGTVKIKNEMNTSILLEKSSEYKEEEGIRLKVNFTKHRLFYGEMAKPFEVQMVEQDGAFRWSVDGHFQCSEVDQILDLMADGMAKGKAIKTVGIPNASFYDHRNNKISFDEKLKSRYKARREAGTIGPIKQLESKMNQEEKR